MGGKPVTVTDPMGNTTEYAYDPLDNLTAIRRKGNSGGKDHATVYERDSFGRVLCITDPLGMKEHFRYDALGRPVWKKDRDGNEMTTAYTRTGQPAGICYADGTAVEMQYDALDRLTRVKDSLGTTSIGRDRTGRITAVTGHNGQTVSYEWGAQGERKSTTYPDGQQTVYSYDSLQRLTAVQIRGTQTGQNSTEDPQTITYRYDDEGRLTEKVFPDGIRTTWQYDREDGLPVSLTHTDQNGVLDRYTYAYDPMGNKTAVTRQRRGLPRESGAYTYTYDPIGRLTAVAKDGTPLRDYAYDPFSNRAHMTDHHKGSATAYTYDAADRLTMTEETTAGALTRKTYEYDHRGNLTKELQEGIPVHSYAYNAMDRLEKAWSHTPDGAVQTETAYYYNGLGQRVGKSRYTGAAGQPAEITEQPADSMGAAVREDYLLDLTRPYHNLLSVTRNDGAPAKTFHWDSNAAAMEENGRLHYYLQDEMGSPVRVSGYDGTESMADGNHDGTDIYLTYGYDEFGNDLARTIGKELEEDGIPNPYTMQGEGQPFGYTGYRYDTDSGTYFAQAREYQPQSGRFCAQDVIAGNGAVPVTLNRYIYCLENPVNLTDRMGMKPDEDTYEYDRDAAIQYAETWATKATDLRPEGEYILGKLGITRNPEYYSYRTNCANFVSQCLVAGGIEQTEDWYFEVEKKVWESGSGNHYIEEYQYNSGEPWRLAGAQYEFFSNPDNGFIRGDVINISSVSEMEQKLEAYVIQKGDLMYFYDEDGVVHHATIISNIDGRGILYSGNTSARYDYPLRDAFENGENGVYIVRIKDDIERCSDD